MYCSSQTSETGSVWLRALKMEACWNVTHWSSKVIEGLECTLPHVHALFFLPSLYLSQISVCCVQGGHTTTWTSTPSFPGSSPTMNRKSWTWPCRETSEISPRYRGLIAMHRMAVGGADVAASPDGRGFPSCETISCLITKKSCADSKLMTWMQKMENPDLTFSNFILLFVKFI